MDILRSLAVYAGGRGLKTNYQGFFYLKEINKILAVWTRNRGIKVRIEVLSASGFSEAARSLSQAFLVPGRSKFVNVAKKRLIELRDLYSLHSTSRKSEAFAILGVWDDDRKRLLASVQVNRERDPVILKHLPEGTESYVYGSRLAVSPEARGKGIGRAMVEAVTFVAKSWNEKFIVLSVYSDNERAKNLYLRMGYKKLCLDPRSSEKENKKRPALLCALHVTPPSESD